MPKNEQDDAKALYRNGKMTRAGMVRVIEGGGSVLHQGAIYSKVDDLPDEATLAEGDTEAADAALAALDAEQARITAQRAALERTRTRATEGDTARAKAEAEKKAAPAAETDKPASDKPVMPPPKK